MFLIPTSELTLTDIRGYRAQAKGALIDRAIKLGLVTNPKELVIRDGLPGIDFTLVSGFGYWLSGPLVISTMYIYVNGALAVNRVCCFYKVGVESAAPSTARIYFQRGVAGATTIGIVEVEPLYTKLETEGYMSEVAVYDKAENIFIQLFPRLTVAGGERVILSAFVGEPVGNLIS